MGIEINNLNIYRVERPRSPVATDKPKKVEVNKFAESKFAELLSAQEKNFISKNFKTEKTSTSNDSKLGRFLDVKA